jgi:hypothetical protein
MVTGQENIFIAVMWISIPIKNWQVESDMQQGSLFENGVFKCSTISAVCLTPLSLLPKMLN